MFCIDACMSPPSSKAHTSKHSAILQNTYLPSLLSLGNCLALTRIVDRSRKPGAKQGLPRRVQKTAHLHYFNNIALSGYACLVWISTSTTTSEVFHPSTSKLHIPSRDPKFPESCVNLFKQNLPRILRTDTFPPDRPDLLSANPLGNYSAHHTACLPLKALIFLPASP
jgi:hypothetical protein